MASLSIDASDFTKAAEALEAAGVHRLAGQRVAPLLVKSANAVRRNVRARAAHHRRTGKMAGRVQYERSGTGFDTEVKVRAGGPIAHLVEGGAKPHEIRAGKGSGQLGGAGTALTIRASGSVNSRWSGSGRKAVRGADILAVRTKVRHPGTHADPFFEAGATDAEGEIQQLVNTAALALVDDMAARLAGKR